MILCMYSYYVCNAYACAHMLDSPIGLVSTTFGNTPNPYFLSEVHTYVLSVLVDIVYVS